MMPIEVKKDLSPKSLPLLNALMTTEQRARTETLV
jgi:hypothetical protein